MRLLSACLLATAATMFSAASMACEPPAAVAIPDGKSSTMEQMLAAQGQVKAYQASMNEFLACIDGELDAEGEKATEEFRTLMVSRHNAAVTEMENVANAFNEQIKAYRAANPPKN